MLVNRGAECAPDCTCGVVMDPNDGRDQDLDAKSCGDSCADMTPSHTPSPCGSPSPSEHAAAAMVSSHNIKASFSIADILSPGGGHHSTDNLKDREDIEHIQDYDENDSHPLQRLPIDGTLPGQGQLVRPTAVRDSVAVPTAVSPAQWCAAGAASAAAAYQYCYGAGQAGIPGWPSVWGHPGFGRPPIPGEPK